MRILWADSAGNDLLRIRDYIDAFNPSAAEAFAMQLIAAAESLSDFPERGRPIGNGRRELPVVLPYVIRCRVMDDAVVILRIRHSRQAR